MRGKEISAGTIARTAGITPAYAGKDQQDGVGVHGHGITPAYAGKRNEMNDAQAIFEDHPRVCGEKFVPMVEHTATRGSPPRMRGKGSRPIFPTGRLRITPAYAGKRDVTARSAGAAQDHPRVCGEKAEWFRANRYYEGSPPRMRGKVGLPPPFLSMRRITPAYAGKSPKFRNRLDVYKDHPRVCGEKTYRDSPTYPAAGSPPRMRGKASGPGVLSSLSGITPAYAGKSPVRELLLVVSRDHPRVCGEKLAGRCPAPAGLGSPPRMRGKAWLVAVPLPPVWDHPRVCGEKFQGSDTYHATQGSPPRMRGKALSGLLITGQGRITPAYAGKRIWSCPPKRSA